MLVLVIVAYFATAWQRSVATHNAATQTAAQLKVQNAYLRDLALFADYLATTNAIICHHDALKCPAAPRFADPPGLPALGILDMRTRA